jgi:hypothetical protein
MDIKPICRASLILAFTHLSLVAVGGCAVVDQYGARAIEYNEQTAASKSSTILLNILRAAYREPLQFTDVTTVTGTASAQGGVNATIPLRIGGTSFTAPQILELNPSASVSGGPNFSVANLSTQEFYQGLQSPIPAQAVANYAAAGVPLNLLLPLLISDITLEERDQISVLHNTGTSAGSVLGFRKVTKQLVRHGLGWTVREEEPDWLSPELTKKEAADPRLLSGLAQAAAKDDSALTLKPVNASNGISQVQQYRLGRSATKKATLCFRNRTFRYKAEEPDYEETKKSDLFKPIELDFPGRRPIQIPASMFCDAAPKSGASAASKHQKSSVTLRSVEQVFLFLGEVVRTELGLNDGVTVDLRDFDHYADNTVPLYLFQVEQRMPMKGEISANFHGTTYTVAADPSGADASSQVLAILTDLLALQSSAKSLPAPNVIAIAP